MEYFVFPFTGAAAVFGSMNGVLKVFPHSLQWMTSKYKITSNLLHFTACRTRVILSVHIQKLIYQNIDIFTEISVPM